MISVSKLITDAWHDVENVLSAADLGEGSGASPKEVAAHEDLCI